MSERRRLFVVLVVLVAVTAAARIPSALGDPLWLDEVASARVIAQPSFAGVLGQVRRTESTPPLWYVAAWATREASGSAVSVEFLRLLSVVFGCLLTAATVLYARRFVALRWAAFAGLVLALGPDPVAHGAELRAYTLFALLCVCFALLLEGAATRPSTTRLAALAAVVTAGCLTHYFFVLTVVAGLVWLRRSEEAGRSRAVIAVAIGLIPLAAWAPAFLHQYRHRLYAFTGPFSIRDTLFLYARLFGVFTTRGALEAGGRLAVLALVLAGAVVAMRRAARAPALLALGPVTAGAAIWAVGPRVFITRNFLGAAPFAAICVAVLLASLPRRVGAALALAATAVLAFSFLHAQLDWGRASYDRIAAALVAEGWHERDPVLQFGPAPQGLLGPVGWYLPRHPVASSCSPAGGTGLFLLSYDALDGPRWLRAHAGDVVAQRRFAAYDHSPRGPRARTPIVVARLRPTSRAAESARAHGARLYCFRR